MSAAAFTRDGAARQVPICNRRRADQFRGADRKLRDQVELVCLTGGALLLPGTDLARPPRLESAQVSINDSAAVGHAFRVALDRFPTGSPVLLMGHHDADGLGALALLARAFETSGRPFRTRVVGRGESPWSSSMRAELAPIPVAGIISADLGVRAGNIKDGAPTILIDHHVPRTEVAEATVISGHGLLPTPTSSLLAYWCAATMVDVDPWLWIAALGIIGDMAEGAGFPELALARKRYGITVLRDATALVNAPRRASAADATPALALLVKAEGPRDILSGRFPETAILLAAREEVKRELERTKRTPPIIRNGVALLRIHSACQIHPLVAQAWRGRLRDNIVFAANTGYRPGWVHFAARTARDVNLVDFLARHAPPGADDNYGGGHERASGGALRVPEWNAFVNGLGFGAEARVEG